MSYMQQPQQKYQQMPSYGQQNQQGYQHGYQQQGYPQAGQAQPGFPDARSAWQQSAGAAAVGWQQAAPQQQQLSPAPAQQAQMQMQQQQQQQQQQQADGDEGIGNERQIFVSGCTHGTVGSIVRGSYTLSAENHGKPAYRKDAQVNGLDVMLYFWDERDGPNFCGWWFGPKIGGDQVWAYHPSRTSKTAPKTGWKVPYDGPVDPTFLISKAQQAAQPQAPQQAQQGWNSSYASRQQQYAQQQQASQNQHGLGAQPQQQQPQQQPYNQMAQMQQSEHLRKLQMQQAEITKRQLDENRKKLEDANRRRIEEQRRRVEEVKKQQEDLRKRQEEEKLKREQEMAQKREEQRATLSIRRVILKVRAATVDNIEELQKELDEVLQKELANCGSQNERMKQEADSGLEQANQRIEMIKEQQRKVEEQRLEAERKRKEAQERAEELLRELDGLVTEAERVAKVLKEETESFSGDKELGLEEVMATAKAVDEAGQEAKDKMKACTDFILSKGSEMRTQDAAGQPPSETKQTLAKLLQRINECTRGNEALLVSARESKEKAIQRAEARKQMTEMIDLFDKFDADKDGLLSRPDVLKYAKTEFDFALSKSSVDAIFKVLVEEGSKGVKKSLFQKLKVAVGIAREKAIDAEKKAAREAREKRLAELTAELQEKLTDAGKVIEATSEMVAKAEGQAPIPAKGFSMVSSEMLKLADATDDAVKEAREEVAKAKQELVEITEGADSDLQAWLSLEVRKLQSKVTSFEPRLARAANLSSRFREDARKKDAEEVYVLEKKAIALVKYHQQVKQLKNEDVFEAIDSDKDGKIDESEFLEFFAKCERKPKAVKAKTEDQCKEGEPKGEKEEKEGAQDNDNDTVDDSVPSDEELARLFSHFDEDGEGYISKEKFTNLIRRFMKVAKDTVITSNMSIKESNTLRRLEVGEVVEILEGPIKEDKVDVMRVHAKVMKDGLDGWITLAGNQGTIFLEDSGNLFKVVKETILTESFELDGSGSKDTTRKLKVTTRKLKEGEIVEVREWARKEEKSGLMRMKCKAKSDGAIGWVTTIGNQGTVFLEIV